MVRWGWWTVEGGSHALGRLTRRESSAITADRCSPLQQNHKYAACLGLILVNNLSDTRCSWQRATCTYTQLTINWRRRETTSILSAFVYKSLCRPGFNDVSLSVSLYPAGTRYEFFPLMSVFFVSSPSSVQSSQWCCQSASSTVFLFLFCLPLCRIKQSIVELSEAQHINGTKYRTHRILWNYCKLVTGGIANKSTVMVMRLHGQVHFIFTSDQILNILPSWVRDQKKWRLEVNLIM